MVFDHLSQSHLYDGVSSRMRHAFAFLRRSDAASLANGRYDVVPGDEVFALVQEYETKAPEAAKWEAHRKYIDVQVITTGAERMGFGHIDAFQLIQPYDESADFALSNGNGSDVIVAPGTFAIFVPHDVHRPTVMVDRPTHVRKIVMKVRVD